MALYALEDLDDAFDATRAFLWPIDRSRWIRLALVVFFVGGPIGNLNLFQYNVPADRGPSPGGLPTPPEIGPRLWLVLGTIVAAALVLGLLFLLVGSIMEFVLVESLRREEVAVRRYWGRRWRQGVRLFGFRLVIGLLVFGGVAVLAALFLLPAVVEVGPGTGAPGDVPVIAFLLLLPVVAVLAIVIGLIDGFTTMFVVPIMILEGRGVLDGWRRLWPTITARPWQYLAYAVAGFVLTIVGGLLVAIAVGVAALVLLIPFGLLGAIGFFLSTAVPPVGLGVLAVVALSFGLSVLAITALVQVPVVTYLRYYALLVLGDVDDDLDLISDRRAAVRADEV
ncbi:DUF7544 domain-containing protein [Halomarina pelagica]|uniref:DUF7544 domain-containing protein n=1 Tax=Halomarina pelagica TaxID=2961599 RepID=UPI0020C1FA92|nr:hypothetical protein [Halomarina sp. BND7]